MFCWPCIPIHPSDENQLDALFIHSLFRQSTSTCFGHICSPSSGGILYIYNSLYVLCFTVDGLLAGRPPDRQLRSTTPRMHLKCDGTRAETRFRLSAKRTSPFKSAGASVQSTAGSRSVRICGSNAGYTMFRGSTKGTGYLLPFSSLPVRHRVPSYFSWTYQLFYIYSIPPDDGLQICPKHVQVDLRNKLRINIASCWFTLHHFRILFQAVTTQIAWSEGTIQATYV